MSPEPDQPEMVEDEGGVDCSNDRDAGKQAGPNFRGNGNMPMTTSSLLIRAHHGTTATATGNTMPIRPTTSTVVTAGQSEPGAFAKCPFAPDWITFSTLWQRHRAASNACRIDIAKLDKTYHKSKATLRISRHGNGTMIPKIVLDFLPVVFLVLTVLLILLFAHLLFRQKILIATSFSLATVIIFCGLMANANWIESFTASPTSISATLTRVNSTVDEAKTLFASLRSMQLAYGRVIFQIVADPDPLINPQIKYARRDAMKQIVVSEARRAGLDDAQIREIQDEEKGSVSSEYVAAIVDSAYHNLNGRDTRQFQMAIGPLMSSHPSADQLEEILNKCHIDDDQTRALITDYRFYLEKGEHRRPEIWKDRYKWMVSYIGWDK